MTACPVLVLTTLGAVTGPVTVMIGRVSNVPPFVQSNPWVPGGTCAGKVTGKPLLNGSDSGTGGGVAVVLESVCVVGEYLRGSGADQRDAEDHISERDAVLVTSALALRLTYASLGTGSS